MTCYVPARESAAQKGKRYAAEGRLTLTLVAPGRVRGTCKGGGHVYSLAYVGGRWYCSCPARSEACAHVRAAQLVTVVNPEGETP